MADEYAILPARPASDDAGGTLAVRELQPLAAMDDTPDDLSRIANKMALNPVCTRWTSPRYRGRLSFIAQGLWEGKIYLFYAPLRRGQRYSLRILFLL